MLLPTAPTTPYHRLAIVALSYLDILTINLTADSDRAPDSAKLAETSAPRWTSCGACARGAAGGGRATVVFGAAKRRRAMSLRATLG